MPASNAQRKKATKSDRRVHTTNCFGATPVKQQLYNIQDPPDAVDLGSPITFRGIHSPGSSASPDRPKTSRGVANPTVDEWTDYVSPSPNRRPPDNSRSTRESKKGEKRETWKESGEDLLRSSFESNSSSSTFLSSATSSSSSSYPSSSNGSLSDSSSEEIVYETSERDLDSVLFIDESSLVNPQRDLNKSNRKTNNIGNKNNVSEKEEKRRKRREEDMKKAKIIVRDDEASRARMTALAFWLVGVGISI